MRLRFLFVVHVLLLVQANGFAKEGIRTHEGWLYLAVVVDLFSRQVVGWSMGSRIDTSLVLDALLMALWPHQSRAPVIVHSDQGCQFTGHEWQTFLRDHNLVSSMSRRGNCHDNAVAESFFQLLKRERIRRRVYATRDDARADVFNYIEMFYNSQSRHSSAAGLSPVEFEQRHSQRLNGSRNAGAIQRSLIETASTYFETLFRPLDLRRTEL